MRRGRAAAPPKVSPAPPGRTHLPSAAVAAAIAIGAIVLGASWGSVHPSHARFPMHYQQVRAEIWAWGSAAVVLFSGVIATRRTAAGLGNIVAARTITAAGSATRLVISLTGYIVVFISVLGVLAIPFDHLLTDATLVGVVLGIAATQTLGNVFAGMVLLLARPFTIGDAIRVRSGALGGLFNGVVLGMSLTYVTMSTDDGLLKVPNSGMLAAAVGPFRAAATVASLAGPVTGQTTVTGSVVTIPEPGTDTRPPTVGDGEVAPYRPSPWRELAARDNLRGGRPWPAATPPTPAPPSPPPGDGAAPATDRPT
jgi:hypothetical protein